MTVALDGVQSPVAFWMPKKGEKVYVWFHGGMSSSNCAKGLVAGTDWAQMHPNDVTLSASACGKNHWVTDLMVKVVDKALDSVALVRKKPIDRVSLIGVSDGALGVVVYSLYGKRTVEGRLLVSSNGSSLGPAEAVANPLKSKGGGWTFMQGGADRLYPAEMTVPWIQSFCGVLGGSCQLIFDEKGVHDWSFWKDRAKGLDKF